MVFYYDDASSVQDDIMSNGIHMPNIKFKFVLLFVALIIAMIAGFFLLTGSKISRQPNKNIKPKT